LNEDVKQLVENCDLEMGHARALLALDGKLQSNTAHTIVEKGFSVRETEQLVRRLLQPAKEKEGQPQRLEEVTMLENVLHEKLGSAASVRHTSSGKGRLLINYSNISELKAIIKRIK